MTTLESRNVGNNPNYIEKGEVLSFIILMRERPDNCLLDAYSIIATEFLKSRYDAKLSDLEFFSK